MNRSSSLFSIIGALLLCSAFSCSGWGFRRPSYHNHHSIQNDLIHNLRGVASDFEDEFFSDEPLDDPDENGTEAGTEELTQELRQEVRELKEKNRQWETYGKRMRHQYENERRNHKHTQHDGAKQQQQQRVAHRCSGHSHGSRLLKSVTAFFDMLFWLIVMKLIVGSLMALFAFSPCARAKARALGRRLCCFGGAVKRGIGHGFATLTSPGAIACVGALFKTSAKLIASVVLSFIAFSALGSILTFCPLFGLALLALGAFRSCCGRGCGPCTPPVVVAAQPAEGPLPAAPLRPGFHGPAVAALQTALIELGRLSPRGVRFGKGLYGPNTAHAIQVLQRGLGAQDTGVYDEACRARLEAELATREAEPQQQQQQQQQAETARYVPAAPDPSAESELRRLVGALTAMGYSASESESALRATGSLELALDFISQQHQQREEAPPAPSPPPPRAEPEKPVGPETAAASPTSPAAASPQEAERQSPVPSPENLHGEAFSSSEDEAWDPLVQELAEMGFEGPGVAEVAREARDVKAAVKVLVRREREAAAEAEQVKALTQDW